MIQNWNARQKIGAGQILMVIGAGLLVASFLVLHDFWRGFHLGLGSVFLVVSVYFNVRGMLQLRQENE